MNAASQSPNARNRVELSTAIKAEANRIGFDLAGIAPAVAPEGLNNLREWLARGFAGEMHYISRREEAYAHPQFVQSSVRSIITLAWNYQTETPASPQPGEGLVSRYAWGPLDYHDILREKLQHLADFIHDRFPDCRTRGIVDTAPLLERDFARLAGLGWFGKNTMLLNKRLGSWFFLAGLLVDIELAYDLPHESSHCGTCTRCLDACPTDAFPEPYVLDARKCISYLTIELRNEPIPEEFRDRIGQWLFGCDICQDVCPWNNKAPTTHEPAFRPTSELFPADAAEILSLSEEEFATRFQNSPLLRAGRAGLLRNAAIVLGNSPNASAVSVLTGALDDAEPLIRAAVAWSLGKLGGKLSCDALQSRIDVEDNAQVLEELQKALAKSADNLNAAEGNAASHPSE